MSDNKKKIRDQSRKWLLTINNPADHGMTHDNIKDILSKIENLDYWVMCDEIGGNTKCYHTHLFFYRKKSALKFSYVKALFPSAHFDYPLGTAQQNREYIRKEGKYANTEKAVTNLKSTFEEFGECPEESQGKRNDLNFLYNCIKDGLSDYEIMELNPAYMMRLDKIGYCRQVVMSEEFKHKFRELHIEYRFGKTGKGKSRSISDMYGYGNVYRVTSYVNPFDGYQGQDVIVFEEFRSSLRIEDMLNYLDGYPLELPCRYNNKTACYTKVFINSNIPLEQQYTEIQKNYKETWLAFLRRISCVKEFSDKGIIDYANTDEYINRWQQADLESTPFKETYKQEMLDLTKDWAEFDKKESK